MELQARVQIVAIVVSGVLLLAVLDLVRRRSMAERYALLWLASALVLLALSIWRGLLEIVADVIGIAYAPTALFLIAFGVIMVLLLHFSIAVSRLADQSRVLAQRLALLEERQSGAEDSAAGDPRVASRASESETRLQRAARR
jgi:hypothetical protein